MQLLHAAGCCSARVICPCPFTGVVWFVRQWLWDKKKMKEKRWLQDTVPSHKILQRVIVMTPCWRLLVNNCFFYRVVYDKLMYTWSTRFSYDSVILHIFLRQPQSIYMTATCCVTTLSFYYYYYYSVMIVIIFICCCLLIIILLCRCTFFCVWLLRDGGSPKAASPLLCYRSAIGVVFLYFFHISVAPVSLLAGYICANCVATLLACAIFRVASPFYTYCFFLSTICAGALFVWLATCFSSIDPSVLFLDVIHFVAFAYALVTILTSQFHALHSTGDSMLRHVFIVVFNVYGIKHTFVSRQQLPPSGLYLLLVANVLFFLCDHFQMIAAPLLI